MTEQGWAMHYCDTGDGVRVACLCVHGRDHDESRFDTPVDDDDD